MIEGIFKLYTGRTSHRGGTIPDNENSNLQMLNVFLITTSGSIIRADTGIISNPLEHLIVSTHLGVRSLDK